MNGKGDRNRIANITAYEKNYEKIFGKPKKHNIKEKDESLIKRLKKRQIA